ncbi:MAG: S1 RNA-binding domain-containing protein [Candidatus Omnitrophica bacterium]|nr:S1 RNA-binding domain-containing protein [Candidatus Omnitrophota bacterium]
MEATFNIGDTIEAEVTKITEFGAFAKINGGRNLGLIHISQVSDDFVKDIGEHLRVGDKVKARIIKIGPGKKIDLSLKKAQSQRPLKSNSGFKTSDFEEKLQRFLKESQQSLADLKKHNEKYHK